MEVTRSHSSRYFPLMFFSFSIFLFITSRSTTLRSQNQPRDVLVRSCRHRLEGGGVPRRASLRLSHLCAFFLASML